MAHKQRQQATRATELKSATAGTAAAVDDAAVAAAASGGQAALRAWAARGGGGGTLPQQLRALAHARDSGVLPGGAYERARDQLLS